MSYHRRSVVGAFASKGKHASMSALSRSSEAKTSSISRAGRGVTHNLVHASGRREGNGHSPHHASSSAHAKSIAKQISADVLTGQQTNPPVDQASIHPDVSSLSVSNAESAVPVSVDDHRALRETASSREPRETWGVAGESYGATFNFLQTGIPENAVANGYVRLIGKDGGVIVAPATRTDLIAINMMGGNSYMIDRQPSADLNPGQMTAFGENIPQEYLEGYVAGRGYVSSARNVGKRYIGLDGFNNLVIPASAVRDGFVRLVGKSGAVLVLNTSDEQPIYNSMRSKEAYAIDSDPPEDMSAPLDVSSENHADRSIQKTPPGDNSRQEISRGLAEAPAIAERPAQATTTGAAHSFGNSVSSVMALTHDALGKIGNGGLAIGRGIARGVLAYGLALVLGVAALAFTPGDVLKGIGKFADDAWTYAARVGQQKGMVAQAGMIRNDLGNKVATWNNSTNLEEKSKQITEVALNAVPIAGDAADIAKTASALVDQGVSEGAIAAVETAKDACRGLCANVKQWLPDTVGAKTLIPVSSADGGSNASVWVSRITEEPVLSIPPVGHRGVTDGRVAFGSI